MGGGSVVVVGVLVLTPCSRHVSVDMSQQFCTFLWRAMSLWT